MTEELIPASELKIKNIIYQPPSWKILFYPRKSNYFEIPLNKGLKRKKWSDLISLSIHQIFWSVSNWVVPFLSKKDVLVVVTRNKFIARTASERFNDRGAMLIRQGNYPKLSFYFRSWKLSITREYFHFSVIGSLARGNILPRGNHRGLISKPKESFSLAKFGSSLTPVMRLH